MTNQEQIIAANLRREKNVWSLDNSEISEEGLKANALFKFLVENADIVALTDDDKNEKQKLGKTLESLENQLSEKNANEILINQQIEQVTQELSIYDTYLDVYDMLPADNHLKLDQFVVNGESTSYAVGDQDQMSYSAVEYVENLLDDIGYDGFDQNFVERFLDEDDVVDYFREMYSERVNSDPEDFLSDDMRQITQSQNSLVNFKDEKISSLKDEVEKFSELLIKIKSDKQKQQLNFKITEIENFITDLETEITEIRENPEGDFLDDDIENVIDTLLEDVVSNPANSLLEFDLPLGNFIERDKFIEGVIESDGYEILSNYNGEVNEGSAKGNWYYIIRVE